MRLSAGVLVGSWPTFVESIVRSGHLSFGEFQTGWLFSASERWTGLRLRFTRRFWLAALAPLAMLTGSLGSSLAAL